MRLKNNINSSSSSAVIDCRLFLYISPDWLSALLSPNWLSCRSRTCGRCIRNDVGTSSLPATASASSMKTSLDNSPLLCVQPPGREKNRGGGREGERKEGQVGEERVTILGRSVVPFSLSFSVFLSLFPRSYAPFNCTILTVTATTRDFDEIILTEIDLRRRWTVESLRTRQSETIKEVWAWFYRCKYNTLAFSLPV